MSTVLCPYINLRGDARDAVTFYQSVFGGELTISTFGDYGITDWPDQLDKVMHSRLVTPSGMVLMVSDVPETMELTFGDSMSVCLGGEDEADLTSWYERLSEGGEVRVPLSKAPWGDSFGELRDRFGVRWLVNIAGSPAA